jgi:hypothetical protein
MMLILVGAFLAWIVGYKWWGNVRWGVRSAMCTVIGGLVAYLLLTVGIESIMDLVRASSLVCGSDNHDWDAVWLGGSAGLVDGEPKRSHISIEINHLIPFIFI